MAIGRRLMNSAAEFASLLRQTAHLFAGKRVHSLIIDAGYGQDRYLGNLLVQMYGNCGSLEDAQRAFDGICEKNVYSWTILFTGYAQNGHLLEAKSTFDRMPQRNVVAWNAVVAVYAKNGRLHEARRMFDEMPQRDTVTWNEMIVAYGQCGHLREARRMLDEMPHPDVVSWTSMVTAYGQNGEMQEARSLFDKMPQVNVVSLTAMVAGYAQNGYLQEAGTLFQKTHQKDVVAWKTMITAYVKAGHLQEARRVFEKMPQQDVVSWNAMISAYARNGYLEYAKRMFEAMPQQDVVSHNAMISAYGHNGYLEDAKSMFNKMPDRNVASWNSMVAANALNGQAKEAPALLRLMDLEGLTPDDITFVGIFDACGRLTDLAEGKLIHSSIANTDLETNVAVCTAIINMYGKCGSLEEASNVFDSMESRDMRAWNAMIVACTQGGDDSKGIQLFLEMVLEGMQPDAITFTSILSACSHAGILEDGWLYFVSMQADYGVVLEEDHYICMIDLLGRAGQLRNAQELINSMPFQPSVLAWRTMLAACKGHSDMERGAAAAKHVLEEDPEHGATYVLLSNMFRSKIMGLKSPMLSMA